MATPDLRVLSLATLILAGLQIGLPWAVGGRSPAGQVSLVLLLVLAGGVGLVLGTATPRPQASPLLLLTGLLIGASALHTIYPDRTVQSLLLLLSYLLAAALAVRAARDVPWAAHALLASISLSGILVSLAGMVRIFRGGEGGLYSQVLTGPFGYPNAAGGFLVLAAGGALALARGARGVAAWSAALAAASVSVLGLILTRSHGALMAAAIGLVVWATLDRAVWWPHRRLCAAAGALGLVLGMALWPNRLLGLPFRIWSLFSPGAADSSFVWRLNILKWTWAMVREHAWWGVGPGAFPVALIHYQRIPYVSGQNPHNLYLEIAAEYGLPAAILAVLALGMFLKRAWAATRRTPAKDPASGRLAVLLPTLVAFAAHSLVDLDWTFPAIATTVATMLGLVSAHLPAMFPRRVRWQSLWRGMLMLLLLSMALLSLCRYYANALVGRAQHSLGSRDAALAQRDLTWALRLNPLSFPAHRSMAWAHLLSGDPSGATEAAARSVRIAPSDPNTHYLAGEIAAAAGRWDVAMESFRTAADLAPHSQLRFHAGLVESASNAGQGAEARFRYEQAAAIFTEARVLDLEARCLMPGDRYLFARMSRIAAKAYREAGDSSREQTAMDLAERLAQLDPRGICAPSGGIGQTSPEAVVESFWRAQADGGWPEVEQFLAPSLRTAQSGTNLAMWQRENRLRSARVAWIAALQGNEMEASVRFQVEIGIAPDSSVIRCAQANTRVIQDNWYLVNFPVIEGAPCQP